MNSSCFFTRAQARRPGRFASARARRYAGQSLTEFLVVAPALLFFCFGTVQFVLLYQAKSTLDVATLEAAREGAVNHGSLSAMQAGLARGIAPLYARQASAEGVQAAQAKAKLEVAGYSRIQTVNPTGAMIQDFAQSRFDPFDGRRYSEIPNDTLMYRNTLLGPASRANIQDANLLKIRVHYCYDMVVPLVNKVLYYAVNVIGNVGTGGLLTREPTDADGDPYGAPRNPDSLCRTALQTGIDTGRWRIALESEALVRMQSSYRAGAAADATQP